MISGSQPLSPADGYDLKYDAWNRLVQVKAGSIVVATYAYDGADRRVTKAAGGDTRHYYYDDWWQVVEERLNTATTADRRFVGGTRRLDDLILRDVASEPRLYALDDTKSVTAVVDTSGAVDERYGYNGFGGVLYMNASFGSIVDSAYAWETLFDSYRYDGETGLYQVRYRYLHPLLVRWLNRDPIQERGGLNLYAYVHNNPINYFDPFGLDEFSDVGLSDGILNAAANRSGMAADLAASNNLNNQNPSSNTSRSSKCPGSSNAGGGSPMYGGTFQVGLSLNGQLGPVNGNWNVDLAFDTQGHVGVYDTPGFGGGVGADVSGGLSFAVSNGGSINDLAGPFGYGTGSLGAGLNGTADGFIGNGSQNQPIVGGGFSVGLGGGGGAAAGVSQTYIHPLW